MKTTFHSEETGNRGRRGTARPVESKNGLTGRKGRSKRGPAAEATRNEEEIGDRARNGAPFWANRDGKAPQKSGAARTLSSGEKSWRRGAANKTPPRTRSRRAAAKERGPKCLAIETPEAERHSEATEGNEKGQSHECQPVSSATRAPPDDEPARKVPPGASVTRAPPDDEPARRAPSWDKCDQGTGAGEEGDGASGLPEYTPTKSRPGVGAQPTPKTSQDVPTAPARQATS